MKLIAKHRRVLALSIFCLAAASAVQAVDKPLVVSAASSLKDALLEAGKEFERAHPGSRISFNFSGSSMLANQIEQGAPVDVFASADMAQIKRLSDKNLVEAPAMLAKNKLIVIVSKSSKFKIDNLSDLSATGLRLIMAAKQIPVSAYTRQFLSKAGQSGAYASDYSQRVLANTVSEEPDVRMVAMKVALGEGDAGIVYASDVGSDIKDNIKTIGIPDQINVVAEYGLALIKNRPGQKTAKAFYDLLLSTKGTAILVKHGLLPPR